MPARPTSRNLFGWLTKKKVTYSRSRGSASPAVQAYRAGVASGDTGAFDAWLSKRGFDADRSLRRRLEEQYRRGVERTGQAERVKEAKKQRAASGREAKQQRRAAGQREKQDSRKEDADREREMREAQTEIQTEYAYNMGARHKKEGKKAKPGDAELVSPKKYLGATKARALAHRQYMQGYRANPTCALTRKTNITDRAKRYRANQPGCRPNGAKKCKLCPSRQDLMVDHIDGNESNGRKSNLRWLCRSCNTALGAEMARAGIGRRTLQYNPTPQGGAANLYEYMLAVLQHTRKAHDAGGKIIHNTPKKKRREYAAKFWDARKAHATAGGPIPDWVSNPGQANPYYSVTIFDGVKKLGGRVDVRAVTLQSAQEQAQEYADDMGYDAVLYDVAGKSLGRFTTSRPIGSPARGPNPEGDLYDRIQEHLKTGGIVAVRTALKHTNYLPKHAAMFRRPKNETETGVYVQRGKHWDYVFPQYVHFGRYANPASRNPAALEDVDDAAEYDQAKKTAELFHGRPVKDEITVDDELKTHNWYVCIGPLVSLKVRLPLEPPKPYKRTTTFAFHLDEDNKVWLWCSPDGRQFYLRGGDQELDLDSLGMGPDTEWWRDHMKVGEVTYVTYQDKKKFHQFKLTDYYHKIGTALDKSGYRHIERTKEKPTLVFDTLSKKLSFIGGLAKVELETLVDGMSPGIVD